MQDTVATPRAGTKTDIKTRVFISYSRKDMAFADTLEAALKARGFEVLIDREEIYAFEDWWKRIEALIGGADTVVFVLSPDSVKSEVALKEIAHAASLNKRFAPIVCRRVDDAAVPEALRRLNFIFFDDADHFDESANHLAEALRTDIGWVRQHTEYGEAERLWSAAGRPGGLLLHSPTLEVAEYWIGSRPAGAPEATEEIRSFVAASRKADVTARRRSRVLNATLYAMLLAIILGLVGWINQDYLKTQWHWWTITRPYARANVWPYVMSAAKEQALKSGDSFKECAADCPEMIVVPAGSFIMGSPAGQGHSDEHPQHNVTIRERFSVSKFELTVDEWNACITGGGCNGYMPDYQGFRNGQEPMDNVSWYDAQAYVAWLSQVTGKPYRLLSEAEYEYAARAGTTTAYPWGDNVKLDGKAMANCNGCGSEYANTSAPVGSFPANKFGLHDMAGNVQEWTEDCVHPIGYGGAPTDGAAWTSVDMSAWLNAGVCIARITRGGSWSNAPDALRSASRAWGPAGNRNSNVGFRVARTLLTP